MEFENKRDHPFDNLRECELFDARLGNTRAVCWHKERVYGGILLCSYRVDLYYRDVWVKHVYYSEEHSEALLSIYPKEVGFRVRYGDQDHSMGILSVILESLSNDWEWGNRRMELESAWELDVLEHLEDL